MSEKIQADLGNKYYNFQLIGNGSFANVYSAYSSSSKEKVAIKHIDLKNI